MAWKLPVPVLIQQDGVGHEQPVVERDFDGPFDLQALVLARVGGLGHMRVVEAQLVQIRQCHGCVYSIYEAYTALS